MNASSKWPSASKLGNVQMRNPQIFAGRRIQDYHAMDTDKNYICYSNYISVRGKRQASRILATRTSDVGQLEATGEQQNMHLQACKMARQRPLSFFGGAIVGILALDISQGVWNSTFV